ncbi:MAG: hypothetical protein QOI73_2440, partial [Solirubrobacteraceae bacterium]|nr:hypothetical protein [Solirubrobacteraceae bacterium]
AEPAAPALAPVQVDGDTTSLGQPPTGAPPPPTPPSPVVVIETSPPAPAGDGSETTLIVSGSGPIVSP